MSSNSAFKNLSLEGQVALVTGGSTGIGAETAKLLAARGAKVVITARDEKAAQPTVDAIRSAGGEVTFFPSDVSKEADVANLVKSAVDKYGRLDIAFNNAGILPEAKKADELDLDLFRQTQEINVQGVVLAMKYEIQQFQKQVEKEGGKKGEGELTDKAYHRYSIVNTSSIAGVKGSGNISYTASKWAVIGLTKAAAKAYGPLGVRVNCVCPGAIETDMIQKMDKSSTAKEAAQNRIGEADEIAETVAFLLSKAAPFLTGESVIVDGGNTA